MKNIQFSIEINAPKDKVWTTLWDDSIFRDWSSVIDKGTYMKGIMKEDNEVQFITSVNGCGVTSLIEKHTLNEYALFRHEADTKDIGKTNLKKDGLVGLRFIF